MGLEMNELKGQTAERGIDRIGPDDARWESAILHVSRSR